MIKLAASLVSIGPILLILILVPTMASGQSSIAIETEGRTVRASGLSRGAEVAWMASLHENVREAYFRITSVNGVVTDEDGDGVVEIELDREIPSRFAIVVVDRSNGESATLLPPEDYRERRSMNLRLNGDSDDFELDRDHAEVMMVRPGRGSWHLRGDEPDRAERSRGSRTESGRTRGRRDSARGRGDREPERGDEEPPASLVPGDRVIALDPMRLEISILELN